MPRILAVVSPGNNSGKTRLASTILAAFPRRFAAMKVSTVYRDGEMCPKSENSCACRELHGAFTVITDPGRLHEEGTDTGRLARAGASRVLWCLAKPSAHESLWRHLSGGVLGEEEALLTEGNKIAGVCSPRGVVVVAQAGVARERWKSDVWDLVKIADLVVVNDPGPDAAAPLLPHPAGSERLAEELRAVTGAPVVVENVARPLSEWRSPILFRLAEDVLSPARAGA